MVRRVMLSSSSRPVRLLQRNKNIKTQCPGVSKIASGYFYAIMLYKAIYVVYIYVGLILQLFGGMKRTAADI